MGNYGMKRYIDKNTDKEKIKKIINEMLDDREFWAGGITDAEKKLHEELGFTIRQSGKIERMLKGVANRLAKKI